MIWRSALVFLTSLTALSLPVTSLRAESALLLAQSSAVDPSAAIDTGRTTPNIGANLDSPLEAATSEQQIEEIKGLQRELQKRGFYNGPIDGIYGPMTAEAIRTLRGQDGNQPSNLTPRQFVPDTSFPVTAAETPAATEGQPNIDASAADEPDADLEINTNAVDAASADPEPEEINIGDDDSLAETDVDGLDGDRADAAPAAAPAAPQPGIGRLLWPGLALIAALGSFGIGFVLANRVKTIDEESASSWGDIPNMPPQPDPPSAVQPLVNGQNATNGTGPDPTVGIVVPKPMTNGGSMVPIADTGNGTTRLAKVDVIDDLVSNLQAIEPATRRKAIWELGQRGNSSAVQHLVNRMVDADSKEKSLILAALSEIGIRSLKPMNRALAIALQDDNPDVRKNAIRDLTRVYELVTQISQMLGHATEDEDSEVRRTAEWALEQLNRIREAPKLKSSINTLEASRSPSELLPDEVENLKN